MPLEIPTIYLRILADGGNKATEKRQQEGDKVFAGDTEDDHRQSQYWKKGEKGGGGGGPIPWLEGEGVSCQKGLKTQTGLSCPSS